MNLEIVDCDALLWIASTIAYHRLCLASAGNYIGTTVSQISTRRSLTSRYMYAPNRSRQRSCWRYSNAYMKGSKEQPQTVGELQLFSLYMSSFCCTLLSGNNQTIATACNSDKNTLHLNFWQNDDVTRNPTFFLHSIIQNYVSPQSVTDGQTAGFEGCAV